MKSAHFPVAVLSSILTSIMSFAAAQSMAPLPTMELLWMGDVTDRSHVSDGTERQRNGVRRFLGPLGAKGVTYNGHQYVVYFTGKDRSLPREDQIFEVVVARRPVGTGEWSYATVPGVALGSDDAHNRHSIGVSEQDGTLHITFDHHNTPTLNYARTAVGVLNDPDAHPWVDGVVFNATNLGSDEFEVGSVTYPSFQPFPGGGMLLYYRDGGSYGGDMRLARYDGDWQWIRELSSREGTYNGKTATRGPYLSGGIKAAHDGTLMMSWVWRERGLGCAGVRERVDEKSCNQGIYVARSEDEGMTWSHADGRPLADMSKGRSISIDSFDEPLVPVPEAAHPSNVLNASAIDNKTGAFHIMNSHYEAPYENAKRSVHHYIVEPDGTWRGGPTAFSASNVELAFAGDVLFAFGGRADASVQAARRDDGFATWTTLRMPTVDGKPLTARKGYVTWDLSRLEEGVATYIWHQPSTDTRGGVPSPVTVVDLRVAEIIDE